MPEHREAKAKHDRWIGDYRVVISEVETVYGNSELGLQHQPAASVSSGWRIGCLTRGKSKPFEHHSVALQKPNRRA